MIYPFSVHPHLATEIEQLRLEVADLTSLVKSITQHQRNLYQIPVSNSQPLIFFGTANVKEIPPRTVKSHVPSWETPQPAASGDKLTWPFSQLPLLHN